VEEPHISAAPAAWVAQTSTQRERCFLRRLTELDVGWAGELALCLFLAKRELVHKSFQLYLLYELNKMN